MKKNQRMMTYLNLFFMLCVIMMSVHCAEPQKLEDATEAPKAQSIDDTPGEEAEAENTTFNVDATSQTDFNYIDLDKYIGADDGVWDLGFRRYVIVQNTEVPVSSAINEVTLTELSSVPEGPWLEDELNTTQVYDTWYNYNSVTHVLTPQAQVYVVKTSSGSYVGLSINSYYDGVGSPAIYTLTVKDLSEGGS